ncbi:MAG: hypothetical protein PHF86_12610 [Candidatus Nanoarchaeia archaeon]|jgi:hypothetical protein|nr:hypothetical protein [Candidatus Nanoarchaeia archaeon]
MKKEDLANRLFSDVNAIVPAIFKGCVIYNRPRGGWKVKGRFQLVNDISFEDLVKKLKGTNLTASIVKRHICITKDY